MSPPDTYTPKVLFYSVRTIEAKLYRIVQTAQLHFDKNLPLLFFVEDEKGEKFVDELLWRLPIFSFLPHKVLDGISTERIGITREKKNLNGAKGAFNLCPTPLFVEGPFKIIYELEDFTSEPKRDLSTLRYDAYRKAHLPILSSETLLPHLLT